MTGAPEGPGTDGPPQYTAAHAHDALAADARLAALDVEVRVVGRKVFVSGTVNTDAQREAAGEVIETELPGFELHNELTLVDCSEATETETERLS
jgi:hypothetical protein